MIALLPLLASAINGSETVICASSVNSLIRVGVKVGA